MKLHGPTIDHIAASVALLRRSIGGSPNLKKCSDDRAAAASVADVALAGVEAMLAEMLADVSASAPRPALPASQLIAPACRTCGDPVPELDGEGA